MDLKASALHRAEDQQGMGAYLHQCVQGSIADLPAPAHVAGFPQEHIDELLAGVKAQQDRRALHYSRARNLLGLHD